MARLPVRTNKDNSSVDFAVKNIFPNASVPIKEASYGVKPSDSVLTFDVSQNPITVVLSEEMLHNVTTIKVVAGDLAVNNITILAPANHTINGEASLTLQDISEGVRIYKPNFLNDYKYEFFYADINEFIPVDFEWTANGQLEVTYKAGNTTSFVTPYFIDGVLAGFEITQDVNPNAQSFDLAAGLAQIDAQLVTVPGAAYAVSLNPSLTDSRIDLFVLDATGTITVVEGTPDVNPVPPPTPVGTIVLYEIGISPEADGTDPSKFSFAAANFIGPGSTSLTLPNGTANGQPLAWNNPLQQWRVVNNLILSNGLISAFLGELTIAAPSVLSLTGNDVSINAASNIQFISERIFALGNLNLSDGTATAPTAGDIRYLGGSFGGYNGTTWIEFGTAPVTQVVAPVANAITANLNSGDIVRVTLDQNITTVTLSNAAEGVIYILELIQGGTGSYTVTWPAGIDFGNYGVPILSTAVGRKDLIYLYRSNGKFLASYAIGYTN
jgi:hypothetical protein